MPIINNPFNGKLNLDVAEYRISNGDYIDALNITKDAQGRGQDRVVSNILGNTLIPYTLPAGDNKIIGFYPDKIRNRAYYFLWNSNGYNSILYYSADNEGVFKVFESKTDSDGIDILNFNPSYKVLSINIFYRDEEGDLLFFNDGLNPPKNINVTANYGTSWKLEYLLVAKAPPIMPPKVVYENDDNVNINNLRNSLFQFSYRYVYDNNEKSVWGSKSIVPLPQQDTLLLTGDTNYHNNARISVSVTTGGVDVKAIEISFRETTNGVTSDWYLIGSFDKNNLSLADNDIYTYKFYNDGIYSQIDILQTTQLQDWVPQRANAAELANGNVLLYSGITEGYDKTNMDLIASSTRLNSGYYFDKCGLLFFATCNGEYSGADGNILKIYLYGTGTNVAGNVSELNNASGEYVINAYDSDGNDIGASYTSSSTVASVSTILNGIKFALISNGWTFVSLGSNMLTMSYSSFKLLSSGTKYYPVMGDPDNTVFANAWESGYQYALQYFDAQGRTIGAQTDIDASFTTQDSSGFRYPITQIQIKNRPPLEARYYQILRSNNTTYSKRLFWISQAAYSSNSVNTTVQRFAYIDIANINYYNQQISSTQGVVSYSFTQGDRVRFLQGYDAENNATSLNPAITYDYEVLGTETTIKLADGTTKVGYFIKILYPTADIGGTFQFTGESDFLHYEVFLYNYVSNVSSTQRFFYECGFCFGIGNAGTANAYHIGLSQTQSSTNPSSQPAIVELNNGDLFYRKRKVPYNDDFIFASGASNQDITSTIRITLPTPGYIDNTVYRIQSEPFNSDVHLTGTGFPVYSSTGFFFNNKLTGSANSLLVRAAATFSVYQSASGNTTVRVYAIICANESPFAAKTALPLNETQIVQSQTQTEVSFDSTFNVPPTGKVWFAISTDNPAIGNSFTVNSFNLEFSVLKNNTINIIEQSFNDTYNLITNSNGRVSTVDENAQKTYFPTLIRFGGAYQVNTNINQINNFQYEDFDEYDRSFGDVMRLHVRDRYLKVYQKFKVGNVPILTQIVKDVTGNPLQANTNQLINKVQYYAGEYGIGDASTSLAWNNFADYFVDNYRGVVCRLSQDGITPISILYNTNAFFVPLLSNYRKELNNGVPAPGENYQGDPCIYGVFDAYTNKYIIAMEEINRYSDCGFNGGTAYVVNFDTTTTTTTTTTSTTTTTTTASPTTTTTTTTEAPGVYLTVNNPGVFFYPVTAGNGSASGTIRNTLGVTIFIYLIFNSGGNTSGSCSSDSGDVNGLALNLTGTITGAGQNFYSSNYYTLANGVTKAWTLSKQDGLSSGASLKLGYSTTVGGSITPINA